MSVGIFPYVLKLLQTTAMELRQILVFIWTKILALDKVCAVFYWFGIIVVYVFQANLLNDLYIFEQIVASFSILYFMLL